MSNTKYTAYAVDGLTKTAHAIIGCIVVGQTEIPSKDTASDDIATWKEGIYESPYFNGISFSTVDGILWSLEKKGLIWIDETRIGVTARGWAWAKRNLEVYGAKKPVAKQEAKRTIKDTKNTKIRGGVRYDIHEFTDGTWGWSYIGWGLVLDKQGFESATKAWNNARETIGNLKPE